MSTISSVSSPLGAPTQNTNSSSSASGGTTSTSSSATGASSAGAGAAAGGGGASDTSSTTTTVAYNADGTETITTKNAQGQVISVVTEGVPNEGAQSSSDPSAPAGSRFNVTT